MKIRFTALLLCLVTVACGSDSELSPEQQVKEVLAQIEENVEKRSRSGVLAFISDDYQDHRGRSKQDIARILQMHFIRNQQINAFTLVRSIEIDEGLAMVELSTAMAGQEVDLSQEGNRLRADTHRFSVVLSADEDQWQVSSVSWQRGW